MCVHSEVRIEWSELFKTHLLLDSFSTKCMNPLKTSIFGLN